MPSSLSSRAAWVGLAATLIVLSNMMFAPKDDLDKKIVSVGVVDLDGGPFWDEAFVRKLCEGYGAEGRLRAAAGYLGYLHDCTFALCYSVTMALSLFAMVGHTDRRWLCVVPLLAGLCDLGENFSVVRLLLSYPDLDRSALTFGPRFSLMKTVFGLAALGAIVYHRFLFRDLQGQNGSGRKKTA